MKFLLASVLAATAAAQTAVATAANRQPVTYAAPQTYGTANWGTALPATNWGTTNWATPAATNWATTATAALPTNWGTSTLGSNWGTALPATNWGNTLTNWATPAATTATVPLYTRSTAATTALPTNWGINTGTNWNTVLPATNFGTTLGNYGLNYGSTLSAYPYTVPRTNWAVPQTCSQRAPAVWNIASDFAATAKKLYDGRTITWYQFPTPVTVTNKAEFDATIDGWAMVAAWTGKTLNSKTLGNTVTFEVDWTGSKSLINGYVIPANAPTTYHVFDCNTNTEIVYADFTGVLKAMGAV